MCEDGNPPRKAKLLRPEVRGQSARVAELELAFGLLQPARLFHKPPAELESLEGLILITGFSGSGKSTLLRDLVTSLPEARRQVVVDEEETRSPVDMFPAALVDTVRWLGNFGLAEAKVMCTEAQRLSTGEKARLELALTLWDAPKVVILDEFLSTLDRINARAIAHRFQKLARRGGHTIYIATAHNDLTEPLGPDHLVSLDQGEYQHSIGPGASSVRLAERDELEIEPGKISDISPLKHFHYVDADDDLVDWSARVQFIRTARFRGTTVATAVYTTPFSPLLNSLPLFAEMNRRILYCHRVIVHPVFRNLGLFRALQPEDTSEATVIVGVSAMGRYFPFYLGAGYQETLHPRTVRTEEHDRLAELLEMVGKCSVHYFQSAEVAARMLASMSESERASVEKLVLSILSRDNLEHVRVLAALCGLADETNQLEPMLRRFFHDALSATLLNALPEMITQAVHFPMQIFFKPLGTEA